mmetsp:Transcript_40031/g.92890  ORF Transcript_40031/g.92890 Transcript_40031/m.92890 type:complete len:384 (+) Transcript_40031:46-1197(+)
MVGRPRTLGAAYQCMEGAADPPDVNEPACSDKAGTKDRASPSLSRALLTAALVPAYYPKGWSTSNGIEKSVLTFRLGAEVMGYHWGPWLWILGFAFLQLLCWMFTGDSLFGNFTGGILESFHLRTGLPMTWHMCCGSAMWALGFVQIFCKRLRHGSLAWVHRISGRLCLLLWCFVVGPTAAYLSLYVSAGPSQAHIFMTLFALMGMDTTLFAYYYMWRALVIIRCRELGEDRLDVHGRAMRVGIGFTMLILFQRPMQFMVMAFRKTVVLLAALLPPLPASWGLLQAVLGGMGLVLDHHVILSATTAFPMAGVLLIFDGPRSRAGHWLLGIKTGEETVLFGSAEPGRGELLFWRLRLVGYLLLRAVVTRGWAEDPLAEDSPLQP